jgi:hypothetical protein
MHLNRRCLGTQKPPEHGIVAESEPLSEHPLVERQAGLSGSTHSSVSLGQPGIHGRTVMIKDDGI